MNSGSFGSVPLSPEALSLKQVRANEPCQPEGLTRETAGVCEDSVSLVSMILPTYEEAENLPWLIPQIGAALELAGIAYEILVCDDDSPDGTAEIARELAAEWPVRVLPREGDRGLARSVIRGLREAVGDVCVVMDADGSHPVESIIPLLQPVFSGEADVVVGSRYLKGGGADDWVWYRRLISRVAKLAAVGVSTLTDPTSGMMAVRRSSLDLDQLDPLGWKIVLEVAVRQAEGKTIELPIQFENRHEGKSKLSWRENFSYLAHLTKLRWFHVTEVFKRGKRRERLPGLALLLVGLVAAFILCVGSKEFYAGDEGVNGIMARNILHDVDLLIRPSYTPTGEDNWGEHDVPGIAVSPFHSLLLAGGISIAKDPLQGMGGIHLLFYLGSMIAFYGIVRGLGREVALLGTAIFGSSSLLLQQFSLIEMEPAMVCFGLFAILFFLRSLREDGALPAFLGGGCLGFCYLCKFWLAAPFFGAIGMMALVGLLGASERLQTLRLIGSFALGSLLTGGSHLFLVGLFSPADLIVWLRDIYFGVFSGGGVQGSKVSGAGVDPNWIHGWGFYFRTIFREHYLALGVIALAGISVVMGGLRNVTIPARSGLIIAAVLGAIIGTVPLNFFLIKEPLYIMGLTPFVYLLAALAISFLINLAHRQHGKGFLIVVGSLFVLLSIPMFRYLSIVVRDTSEFFGLAQQLIFLGVSSLMSGLFLLRLWGSSRLFAKLFGPILCATGLVALAALPIHYYAGGASRGEPVQELADLIRPNLEDSDARNRCGFVASHHQGYEFLAFHRGQGFQDGHFSAVPFHDIATSQQIRAIIVGPDDLKNPEVSELVANLGEGWEEHTRSRPLLAGEGPAYQVYLRK